MARLAQLSAPADAKTQVRAKDLKNQPLLVKPGERQVADGADGEPWVYITCDVITLDRQGIVEQLSGVRFSWVRALRQLEAAQGSWLACKPYDTGEGVVLLDLAGPELEVAERVLDELDDE